MATRALDGSGGGYWEAEIDLAAAVARRRAGQDTVVRGNDLKTNRSLAQAIEALVGPYMRGTPHKQSAGPLALPHFQQATPPPAGQSFYKTPNRMARKKP